MPSASKLGHLRTVLAYPESILNRIRDENARQAGGKDSIFGVRLCYANGRFTRVWPCGFMQRLPQAGEPKEEEVESNKKPAPKTKGKGKEDQRREWMEEQFVCIYLSHVCFIRRVKAKCSRRILTTLVCWIE